MNFPKTLAFRLIVLMAGAFAITSLAAFFLIDVQVKGIVDRNQGEVYGEKLDGVGRLLDTRVRRLEATGMRNAYEEDFKDTALGTLRDLYHGSGGDGGRLIVLDRQGTALLHPGLPRGGSSEEGVEVARRLSSAPSGEFDWKGPGGERRWIIYRHFPAWDWIIVYSIPWGQKYGDRTLLQRELFRVMGVITVAVLGLLFAIVTYVTRPIARLTRAAGIMAGGDLNHPIETSGTGGTGEVGLLAEGFIRLRDSIRARLDDLAASNEELRREIESRLKAEASLEESEELLHSIINSLDDLVFVLDRDLRFVDFWQPHKLDDLYLPPEMFVGRTLPEITLPPDARDIWLQALKALETSPEVQAFDYRLAMPAGETWYSAKASRRIDAGGRFAGVTVVVRNITDRKLAEWELERQNVELRKLDKMKDELVRNVSHELKTPVAKQAMQLEILYSLLEEGMPKPEVEAVLAVMEASVKRQQQVIRSLLDIARLESGHRTLSIDPVRLDEVAAEIIEEFRALTEKAGVTVELNAEPVTVEADRGLLWHIVSNLFSNALKFRRNGVVPRIGISVTRAGEGATVTVSDNGIGMTREELERAFEKFYQASASVEGSGVGLTIAREMAERLGATLSLGSEGRDTGTTATVTFRGRL